MPKAVRVHQTGEPEVLVWEDVEAVSPAAGEVLVRNAAVGLNFLDTYYRSGRYPHPTPFVPGHEGAGTVVAVGPGVTGFAMGDRVGYVDPIGAYAEVVVRPAERLIALPSDIGFETAAAMLLKGITAEYLVRRTYPVAPGETILVHAAAGGVGQLLCQWASHLGATVIGTVGSPAKRRIAERVGCACVVVSGEEDVVAIARGITGGEGVSVVYDGVGADTFAESLRCVRTRGLVVAFGAASGPIPHLDVQALAPGSLYVTRPALNAYTRTADELREAAAALFGVVRSGAVAIAPPRLYPLAEAAAAHADLEARRTAGSTVLVI